MALREHGWCEANSGFSELFMETDGMKGALFMGTGGAKRTVVLWTRWGIGQRSPLRLLATPFETMLIPRS